VLLTIVSIFSSSFMLALSGAMMPGPVFTVTVSESARRGFITGPLMIFGHGILELVLVIALMAGCAPFFARDEVFIAVSLCGGIILTWMAYSMFRDLPQLSLKFEGEAGKQHNLVLTGILLSLANPYWFIWWATIGMGYIMYSIKFGLPGVISFFSGHILADLAWYSLVSFSVAKGGRFFSDALYRRVIGFCASFLLIFAFYFFYSGVTKIV